MLVNCGPSLELGRSDVRTIQKRATDIYWLQQLATCCCLIPPLKFWQEFGHSLELGHWDHWNHSKEDTRHILATAIGNLFLFLLGHWDDGTIKKRATDIYWLQLLATCCCCLIPPLKFWQEFGHSLELGHWDHWDHSKEDTRHRERAPYIYWMWVNFSSSLEFGCWDVGTIQKRAT
jgi:hypothetical protein